MSGHEGCGHRRRREEPRRRWRKRSPWGWHSMRWVCLLVNVVLRWRRRREGLSRGDEMTGRVGEARRRPWQ